MKFWHKVILTIARWLPIVPPTEVTILRTVENVKTTVNSGTTFMMFLKGIGAFKFRKNIQMSDLEIAEVIKSGIDSQTALSVEATIATAWILGTNREPEYRDFRKAIYDRIDLWLAEQDAERAKRLAAQV